MRAAPHIAGVVVTGDAAIRRAIAHRENTLTEIALEQVDIDEALEALIDDVITDADRLAAIGELGIEEKVEAKARDIVAERLRQREPA